MSEADLVFVALLGSPRRDSLTRAIVNTLDELAPDDVRVAMLNSVGDFPIFCEDNRRLYDPSEVVEMSNAILAADAVVIVTPEYNHSVPGGLKNALDWLARLPTRPLAGKPVAIQTASSGTHGGIRAQLHLRETLVALDAWVLAKPEVMIANMTAKVDHTTGLLRDKTARWEVANQLEALTRFVRSGPDRALAPASPAGAAP